MKFAMQASKGHKAMKAVPAPKVPLINIEAVLCYRSRLINIEAVLCYSCSLLNIEAVFNQQEKKTTVHETMTAILSKKTASSSAPPKVLKRSSVPIPGENIEAAFELGYFRDVFQLHVLPLKSRNRLSI